MALKWAGYTNAKYTSRLGTFDGWPKQMKQKPKEFAVAGFYYDGHGDVVSCVACDCDLFRWDVTDDINTKHLNFSPNCFIPKLLDNKSNCEIGCDVCITENINTVLRCGHCFCLKCVLQLDICPKCRAEIKNFTPIYL